MLHANTQHVITFSGEDEIDFLELIQTRSDSLFGTVSSKEGKKKSYHMAQVSKKGSKMWTRKGRSGKGDGKRAKERTES